MWTLVISVSVLLLFFILIIGRKKKLGRVLEWFALLWFKIACVIVLLFVGNLWLNNYGLMIPVNSFSTLTIALLGLPGLLCVVVLAIFNK